MTENLDTFDSLQNTDPGLERSRKMSLPLILIYLVQIATLLSILFMPWVREHSSVKDSLANPVYQAVLLLFPMHVVALILKLGWWIPLIWLGLICGAASSPWCVGYIKSPIDTTEFCAYVGLYSGAAVGFTIELAGQRSNRPMRDNKTFDRSRV